MEGGGGLKKESKSHRISRKIFRRKRLETWGCSSHQRHHSHISPSLPPSLSLARSLALVLPRLPVTLPAFPSMNAWVQPVPMAMPVSLSSTYAPPIPPSECRCFINYVHIRTRTGRISLTFIWSAHLVICIHRAIMQYVTRSSRRWSFRFRPPAARQGK